MIHYYVPLQAYILYVCDTYVYSTYMQTNYYAQEAYKAGAAVRLHLWQHPWAEGSNQSEWVTPRVHVRMTIITHP